VALTKVQTSQIPGPSIAVNIVMSQVNFLAQIVMWLHGLVNITQERDDRMTGTDKEEYIDPHATDCVDPPEGVDFDETCISADEEDDQPV
jgi:hypothetical protein